MAEPHWLHPALLRSAQLLELQPDWNGERAAPIEWSAVKAALDWMGEHMADHSPLPSIVPMSSGGVQLEWHVNGFDFEIAFYPDGTTEAWFERDGNELEGGAALERGIAALQESPRKIHTANARWAKRS